MLQYFKCICIALMAVMIVTGCQTLGSAKNPEHPPPASKYRNHGPPPLAPAHGYRYKYPGGHELLYDSGIGAFIVVNVPDTYFNNGLYMRMTAQGTWLVCTTLQGHWRIAARNEVPSKLQYHYRDKHKHIKKYKRHKKNQ